MLKVIDLFIINDNLKFWIAELIIVGDCCSIFELFGGRKNGT